MPSLVVRFLCVVALALFAVGGASALPPNGPSPSIVISQVYGGGGGTTGSPSFNTDYVELFNRGSTPQSVAGWSIQYASATGTGNFGANSPTPLPSVTIPAGGYLLVAESTGTAGAPLPAPDATGTIAMAAGAGKVALVTQAAGLACNGSSTPCTPAQAALILDLVGYGNANFSEVGPAPTLTTTAAAFRADHGCTDTDFNTADFATGTPAPRNSATLPAPCGAPPPEEAPSVASTNPANGATGVSATANLVVTFSEPVTADVGAFSIVCGITTQSPSVAASPDLRTYTLDPAVDFGAGDSCTTTVTATRIHDVDVSDPPDTMAADYVFSFTVAAPAPTVAIHDIQAATHISPYANQTVATNGIVTAVKTNGFYFQDPNADADPATSEGLFVFTSSAPTVGIGTSVRVQGRVQEFRPGATGLTITELASPLTITTISTGNPLPATILIGPGGRTPPTEVIEDDATGDVETSGVFDPATDGIDFWESLEMMRLDLGIPVAVGPTNSFGETPVLAQNGAGATGRTPRGGILITASDFNPERVVIDDLIVPAATLNVGDHYASPVQGVLDYNFGLFMLEATTPLAAVHDGVTPETTAPAGPDELAVATFNVENLDPGDPQAKFDRLAAIIVANLRSPDLLALEEVQDNTGPTNNGVVDANLTLDRLAAAIAAAGGPAYAYRQVNPVDGADGGEPGGNIRVAFFFRTDHGLSFVDAPGGGSLTPNAVLPSGDLQFSPGRIDPTNTAFNTSRKPLAGQFAYAGKKLFVIVNHFNSKGGDDPLFGRTQPPVRPSETQRHQQATIVRNFSQQILAANPGGYVIALGDFNDFHFSQTLSILEAAPFHTLLETLPPDEQYTYVFEGNSQSLDHILVSDGLFGKPFGYDVVHVNAEFADQASDHDPQLVRLTLNRAPSVTAGGPYSVNEGGSVALGAAGSDPDGDSLAYAWDLDNDGTFETPGQTPSFSAGDGPATFTVTARATDPSGASATAAATVTVANVAPTATFDAPDSATAGGTFVLSLTGASDPSAADTAAGFEYAFDCGSGYGAFGATASANCAATTGTLSVGGKIRDKDGDATEYRDTVTVASAESPYDRICTLARAYSSKKAVADIICAAMDVAEHAAAHGNKLVKTIALAVAEVTVKLETNRAFTKAEAKHLTTLIRALY